MEGVPAALQDKIASVRREARFLYNEVEKIRHQTKDQTLHQASEKVPPIPNHSVNPKLFTKLEGHQNKIASVQWTSDSKYIVSACQDGYMLVWDAVTGLKKKVIQLENPWVLTCAVSSDSRLIASGGLDNNLTIYQIEPDSFQRQPGYSYQKISHVFKGHTAYISECKFLTRDQVLTSSGDMKCMVWDLNKGTAKAEFTDHTGDVLCLDTFPHNTNLFVSGGSDGYCKVWDVRTGNCEQNIFSSNYDVNTLRSFPGSNALVSGSEDGLIRFFDMRSDCEVNSYSIINEYKKSQPTMTFGSNRDSITSVSSFDAVSIISVDLSCSGRLIYACYSDFGCLIWDTLKAQLVGSIGGHLNKINQVKVSQDGEGVCTASWDATMKVWSF